MAAEGDLGRRGDLAELRERVMRDHCVRLAHEGVERLLWTRTDEGGELIDDVGLRGVKLGREAEGGASLDDHFRHAIEAFGHRPPDLHPGFQEWVAFRPRAVEGERLHPLGVFAGEPKPDRAP